MWAGDDDEMVIAVDVFLYTSSVLFIGESTTNTMYMHMLFRRLDAFLDKSKQVKLVVTALHALAAVTIVLEKEGSTQYIASN